MRLVPFVASLLGACVLVGCSDYDLSSKEEEPRPARTEDTAAPDTDPVVDSAADTAVDTGSGVVEVPDTGVVATESVYINTSDILYSYAPASNRTTRIGTFLEGGRAVTGGMTDIAISLDGIMFGGSFTTLYRVNPATAECTRVGALDDEMTGLTFVSDGRLVGAGAAVSIVDTSTGALTTLVRRGEYATSGDIIGLPDGMLYWTVTGGDDLVQIDPATGDTRRMGSVSVSGVYGLGYADGALLGFTSSGEAIVMDTTTGRSTGSSRLSGTWWGATTNPVLW